MIERLCDSVVERLRERMPEYEVDHFPDAPGRYSWAGASQTLLVGYEGSQYGAVESMHPMSASRTVTLSVTLVTRSLRGSLGAMSALEDVRRALFGWRPTLPDEVTQEPTPLGFGPLSPTREGFIDEDEGIWRFALSLSTVGIAVAETKPLDGPPLQGVTFRNA